MIINRYFYKEATLTLAAVLGIIMAIFVSHEFVHYVAKAAAGKVSLSVLLSVMMVQVPYLLGLLLPLCCYLALLFVIGRWSVDSELTVMAACGVRDSHIVRLTLIFALGVTLVCVLMTSWAIPNLMRVKTQLLTRAGLSGLVDTLPPGRFWATKDNRFVAYVEEVSRDRASMQHVFIAESVPANNIVDEPHWAVMSARRAQKYEEPTSKAKYLLAKEGYRVEASPGQHRAVLASFERYGVKLQAPPVAPALSPMTQSTLEIIKQSHKHSSYAAELSWRIGIPASTLLLALMAIPLARVNPREGRFARFFPAIFIYVVYANGLFVNMNLIEKQVIPWGIGLWWLHALAGLVAWIVWQPQRVRPWLRLLMPARRMNPQG